MKNIFNSSILIKVLFLITIFKANSQESTYTPKNGDIIFQTSYGIQSNALKHATKSTLTHCGLIFYDSLGVYVLEAVQPVKLTPLKDFIKRDAQSQYAIKRLANDTLKALDVQKMLSEGRKFIGKNYDLFFNWSNNEIYCSELVWKVYFNALKLELCSLKPLKSYHLQHKDVKDLMAKRYGTQIPYDENMVAPIDIFNSDKLKLIYSNIKF